MSQIFVVPLYTCGISARLDNFRITSRDEFLQDDVEDDGPAKQDDVSVAASSVRSLALIRPFFNFPIPKSVLLRDEAGRLPSIVVSSKVISGGCVAAFAAANL